MCTGRRPRHDERQRWSFGILPVAVVAMMAACGGGEQRPSADTATPQAVAAAPAAQATGEQLYQRCLTCHQANGEGTPGTFPPLAGSEFANAANPAVPIRIVLRGMQGPVTVKGTQYAGVMPPYGTGVEMSDAEVAAVLTYVRQSWGNNAGAVTPEQVAKERAAAGAGASAVTAEELKSLM